MLTNSSDKYAFTTPPSLPAYLPPLPILATIEIEIFDPPPTDRIATFLSILSAPALSSITFRYNYLDIRTDIVSDAVWKDVDKCLARLAAHAKRDGSLTVVLAPWPAGYSVSEECLPEFRKAGGELKVEFDARDRRG